MMNILVVEDEPLALEDLLGMLQTFKRAHRIIGCASGVEALAYAETTPPDLVITDIRMPEIDGIDHPSVIGYADLILGHRPAGRRVAIVGAGGIGFDVAELLCHAEPPGETPLHRFAAAWGIDLTVQARGGVVPSRDAASQREVWLLQRKDTRLGQGLAKTTGWIRRAVLDRKGVHMLGGVQYLRIDDEGLHVTVKGAPRVIACDTVVVCAGQQSRTDLWEGLDRKRVPMTVIGGARLAAELDAMRAIDDGVRLAVRL